MEAEVEVGVSGAETVGEPSTELVTEVSGVVIRVLQRTVSTGVLRLRLETGMLQPLLS